MTGQVVKGIDLNVCNSTFTVPFLQYVCRYWRKNLAKELFENNEIWVRFISKKFDKL